MEELNKMMKEVFVFGSDDPRVNLIVDYHRLLFGDDTMELVAERPSTAEERQLALPLGPEHSMEISEIA